MSDPSPDAPTPLDQMTFAAAIDELARLVAELESDALDVDDLTTRVARAADLVQWCRERIDAARFDVEQVLVRFDDGPAQGTDVDDTTAD